MVLVDTNVLLDIATRDPRWFAWSSRNLAPLINAREAAINPVIYAELAPNYRDERDLDLNLVPPTDFKRLPLPYAAGFPAARAFLAYRKAGKPAPHLCRISSSAATPKRKAILCSPAIPRVTGSTSQW